MGSQRLKSHTWGLHGSEHCPLRRCYGSELGVFVRRLALGTGVSMTPFSALETLFQLLRLFSRYWVVLLSLTMKAFSLSYPFLSYLTTLSWRPALCWQRGSGPQEEGGW